MRSYLSAFISDAYPVGFRIPDVVSEELFQTYFRLLEFPDRDHVSDRFQTLSDVFQLSQTGFRKFPFSECMSRQKIV